MRDDIPASVNPSNLMLSSERDDDIKEIIYSLSRMDSYNRVLFIKNKIEEIKQNGSNNEDINILTEAIKRGGFLRSLVSATGNSLQNKMLR